MLAGQWQEVADYSECRADNPDSFDPTDKWVSSFSNTLSSSAGFVVVVVAPKIFGINNNSNNYYYNEQFNLAYNCLISTLLGIELNWI